MTTLLDAIADEIEGRELLVAARESEIEKLRDELDRLAAMKTTAEGLSSESDSALDAGAANGDSAAAPAAAAAKAETPKAAALNAAARPARHQTRTPASGRGAGELTAKQQTLVDAVNRLGEASTGQVAAAVGRRGKEAAVGSALKQLRERGLVGHNGGRALNARWLAVGQASVADGRAAADQAAAEKAAASPMRNGGQAARLLRSIMDTLGSDPGLTEQQLAQALDVDRDDVAEACGKALERGWVTLAPDGTYYAVTDDDTTDGQGGGTT